MSAERPADLPRDLFLFGCSTLIFAAAFVVTAAGIWLLAQASIAFGLVS